MTTTKQDISHTTLETQNQQVYPQNKEIYCNTPGMVYLVNTGGYYTALFVRYKFKYVLPLFSTLPFRLYVDKFENVPFTQRKIFTSKTTFTPNVMVIHKEYIICVAYLP